MPSSRAELKLASMLVVGSGPAAGPVTPPFLLLD